MEPINEKREKLKEFYYRIKNCSSCPLSNTRINFVFGSGNSNASVLLIGEAPGKNEDLQGMPFVGQAGKLLDGLLDGIGLSRNEVFIANVLKCRPPANRDPDLIEISTCKPYLFEQIEIIDPAVICTMGRYSTQLILNTNEGITKLRGNIFKINGRLILPINHPAAALYAPSRLQILKEDFNRIKSVLDKAIDSQMASKTESLPEAGAPESITVAADKDESSFLSIKYRENEETGPNADEAHDGQAGLADSYGSGQREAGNENQAGKNQQLGLF